ncbi:MAG: CU044_2847 family protein [Geminicoccaceae bacterium]
MAHKIQTYKLSDGGTVAVEVEALPREAERISSSHKELVEETGQSFSAALHSAQTAAAEVIEGFREKLKPDELTLTFGLKFSTKTGIVLASADAQATLQLTAKWEAKDAPAA